MKRKFLVYIFILFIGSGCSVGMAMSGEESPNLGMVKVGASRGEIELTIGTPVKTVTLENNNRMDVYEYEVGNEPSAGRAAGHAVMDLLTLGLWEIIGTPIEANQGDKKILNIIYSEDDRVVSINTSSVKNKTEPPQNEESIK